MPKIEPKKVKRSFTLTDEADQLLQKLATSRGISKTAMLEILIRAVADDEGVFVDEADDDR